MADKVRAPKIPHGCMAFLAEQNNFIREKFPIPPHLPGGKYVYLEDMGNALYTEMSDSEIRALIQIDKINSTLSNVFKDLAHRLNRLDYHCRAYGVLTKTEIPNQFLQTKQVNERFVRIHFDDAVRIISSKIGIHGSKLFNMPEVPREQVMVSENLKQLKPMLDCSCLFYSFINRANINPDVEMDLEIAQLVSINRSINSFSMRLRQLFSIRLPELGEIVNDNHSYARLVKFIVSKPFLREHDIHDLSVILGNKDKAREVVDASKASSGQELSLEDYGIVDSCSQMVINQFEYRERHYRHIVNNMSGDEAVITQLTLLHSIDKGIDSLSKTLRGLLSVWFPELVDIVNDIKSYAELAKFIASKHFVREQDRSAMADILWSNDKAGEVLDASKASMGQDLSVEDESIILLSADALLDQLMIRQSQFEFLRSMMKSFAPNMTFVIGFHLGAELISCAGCLSNLASFTASAIQVLGIEGGSTAKYGIISSHVLVGKASSKNKNRMAHYMAKQCAMAARVDCYSAGKAKYFGEQLWNEAVKMWKDFEEEKIVKEEESEEEPPRIGDPSRRRRRAVKFLRKIRRRMTYE